MTWLPIDKNGKSEREAVLGLHPRGHETHEAFLEACSTVVDSGLLELCRARMAQTLGCREELARHAPELLAQLASRERSSSLTPLQRTALEFVDQFLIDPGMLSRRLVAELENELGTSGVIDFAAVIAAYEGSLRLSALLDLEPAT